MIPRRPLRLTQIAARIALLAMLCAACVATARAGDGTIVYRKVFPSSDPEYVEIRVGQAQGATWDIRQIADPADPQPLEIRPALRAKIFALAAALNNFDGVDLNVHRRLANLGQKTFRYESGGVVHETTFNYTMDQNASQLLEIFEGFTRQQVDLIAIEHSMKYDRLGINDALMQFEDDLNERNLPEPDALLPALDKIAADSRFLNLARERARSLAERIRTTTGAPPASAPAPPAAQTPAAPAPQL